MIDYTDQLMSFRVPENGPVDFMRARPEASNVQRGDMKLLLFGLTFSFNWLNCRQNCLLFARMHARSLKINQIKVSSMHALMHVWRNECTHEYNHVFGVRTFRRR